MDDHLADLQSLYSGKDADHHNQSNDAVDYSFSHRHMMFIDDNELLSRPFSLFDLLGCPFTPRLRDIG